MSTNEHTESNEIMEREEVVEAVESNEEIESTEQEVNVDDVIKKKDQEIAKLNRLLKKGDKPKSEDSAITKEDFTRLELKASGYQEKAVQDLVMSAMKRTGEDADTVLADEYIQAKIKQLREVKKTEAATPSVTTKREAGQSIESLARRVQEGKGFPADRETRDKVRAFLRSSGSKY